MQRRKSGEGPRVMLPPSFIDILCAERLLQSFPTPPIRVTGDNTLLLQGEANVCIDYSACKGCPYADYDVVEGQPEAPNDSGPLVHVHLCTESGRLDVARPDRCEINKDNTPHNQGEAAD